MVSVAPIATPTDSTEGKYPKPYWSSFEVLGLLFPILIFLLLRVPFVIHAAGQMDEQWFSVPGWTVWNEGIPRIPYCPTRVRETFFENADKCLFALPPALHYFQAPFEGILGPGYASSRIPSLLAGIAGLIVLGLWFRRVFPSPWVWSSSLLLITLSRPWMFTSITARPDLCCAVCGWFALYQLWNASEQPDSYRFFIRAGLACGLGMLFHPFALVSCLQCGVWVLLLKGTLRQRLVRGSILTGTALAVFSLWLPLILAYPDEFRSQFMSNVLERSGPGLGQRLLWPWPYIAHHLRYQWEFNSTYQFLLLLIGLPLGTILGLLTKDEGQGKHFKYSLIVWSSCYLTASIAGIHPTKGYWVVPISLAYPIVVQAFLQITERVTSQQLNPSWLGVLRMGSIGCLVVVLLPGAGLRTWSGYMANWGKPEVHAKRFLHQVLLEYPNQGLFMADVNYVFEIYLTGRDTVLCQPREHFWKENPPPLQYLFIGQEGRDFESPRDYQVHLSARYGDESWPSHCWVEVYCP